MHAVRSDDRALEFLKVRHGIVVQHRGQFRRRAGQHDDNLALVRPERAAGRSAVVVFQRGAALRQHRLLHLVFGHAAICKVIEQMLVALLVQNELLARSRRHGLFRQVIARRPKAARRDENITSVERVVNGFFQSAHVVADYGGVEQINAERRKRLCNDCCVRVHGLAEQKLCTYR